MAKKKKVQPRKNRQKPPRRNGLTPKPPPRYDMMGREGHVLNKRKLLQKVVASPNNVRFDDLCGLAEAFGFRPARVAGSHHIFTHPDVTELVNLQNADGQAKPYQVRQFLRLVERRNLTLGDDS